MHYSEEEKTMWLEDWKQSGKKAWAYARENGLIPQTFVGWAKATKGAKTGFIEVPLRNIPPALPASEILIEKGDMRIHLPLGIGGSELRAVVEALGAAV